MEKEEGGWEKLKVELYVFQMKTSNQLYGIILSSGWLRAPKLWPGYFHNVLNI